MNRHLPSTYGQYYARLLWPVVLFVSGNRLRSALLLLACSLAAVAAQAQSPARVSIGGFNRYTTGQTAIASARRLPRLLLVDEGYVEKEAGSTAHKPAPSATYPSPPQAPRPAYMMLDISNLSPDDEGWTDRTHGPSALQKVGLVKATPTATPPTRATTLMSVSTSCDLPDTTISK